MSETRIPVGGDQPYEVIVGTGVLGALPDLVGERAATVAVIHDERLAALAKPARLALEDAGYRVAVTDVPAGEAAKDVTVLARLWSWLAEATVTRSDCVVGIGGGATTDLAGFAAATWLRGVPVVLMPTTLLGMVDAAVGGKTAIDIAAGKNLVGSFHPPAGVLADLATWTACRVRTTWRALPRSSRPASSRTVRSCASSRRTPTAPPSRRGSTPGSLSSGRSP
jgi:3-dehydroquinate synthase